MALVNDGPLLRGVGSYESNEEEDDDSESSRSAMETDNTEEEFEVEDILAERPNPQRPGTLQFLVKWEDYPLADATWEPKEHIRDLYDDWAMDKAKILAGTKVAFNVQEYYDAVAEAQRTASEKYDQVLSDSEDGEAVEAEEDPDFGLAPNPKTQRIIKQTMFRGVPTPRLSQESSQKKQPRRPSETLSRETDRNEPQIPSKPRSPVAAATGYKGTARPPTQAVPQGKSATVGPISSTQARQPTSQALSTSKASSVPGTKPPPNTRAQSPPKSSSLKAKFSGKAVAKRSKPPTSIFIGPRPRKQRPNVPELVINPNKMPSQYTRRYQNQVLKKGIEMNEIAPRDPSEIPKSFLMPSNKPHQTSAGVNAHTPSAPVDANISKTRVPFTQDDDESLFCASPDPVQSPPEDVRPPGPVPSEDRPRKSSLRAANAFETDPRPRKKVHFHTPHPSKEDNQLVDADPPDSGGIVKGCTFGQSRESRDSEVPVKFVGISGSGQPWFTHFLTEEKLHFETTCSVRDFMPQRHMLYAEPPLEGTLEGRAQANSPLLRSVAERLQMTADALYLGSPKYSILLYPSGMSEWDGVASPPMAPPTSNTESEAPLRCIIFKSTLNHALSVSLKTAEKQVVETTALVELLKRTTNMDFSRLKPYHVEGEGKQSYMLVIPPSPANLSRAIQDWLRDCQPNCQIFTSDIPGSFIEAVNQTPRRYGTVIFHESVIPSIRKMPKIDEMIRLGWTFWNLSTGQPHQSSTTISEPGQLSMTRLFPHGKAFLVTPSFVVSDPKGLSGFLDWFKDNYKRPGYVLVVCTEFLTYLRDVALSKIQEGENPGMLEARARAFQIMTELLALTGESADLMLNDRKVEPASDFIHADDEQSLVNWFLWWSTTRMDRHREFVVLGSHPSMKSHAHRTRVTIPNFSAETINDPDQVAAQSANPKGHFQLPKSESSKAIQLRANITETERSKHAAWVSLHPVIVSWLDESMADHFGDKTRLVYDTFSDWLRAGQSASNNNRKLTWFGLFNTIDGDWDPARPASSYGRHPWIAIWRPMDPHLKTHSATELLIWDISADWSSHPKNTEPKPRLQRQMQRHLIDFVRKELFNARLPLERVWVSSDTFEEGINHQDELLDQTGIIFYKLFTDSWARVPALEPLLVGQGWRKLDVPPMGRDDLWREFTKGESCQVSNYGSPMQLRKLPRDADEPVRMIWHPPRSATPPNQRPIAPRCINNLYEAAARERYRHGSCETMSFYFKPTLEWYGEQQEEGRGSSFVRVETGQEFMDVLLRDEGKNRS